MLFVAALLCSVFALATAAKPKIIYPPNGAIIQPKALFDFKYQSVLEYDYISVNYSVILFTTPPTSSIPAEEWAVGYVFGRYSIPNMGNTNPPNRAPSQLQMPDFVELWAGAGRGQSAHAARFYLSVIEEYQTKSGSVGYKMALSTNHIIYNVTHHK
ncbi:hypothetical protein C8J56DRAFT_813638 [Mycena floridula]|nr:hypothetical protein C8J56DRAFT_813638 [Mycena floridula]